MKKKLITVFSLALMIVGMSSLANLHAYRKSNSFGFPKTRTYTKKRAYEGFGQKSKSNGLYKTKITSGHVKRTNKGYTYVNPYARSK